MDISVKYFEKAGKKNTLDALEVARKRAEELAIDQVVVASTHGYTGLEAAKVFAGTDVRIVAVSICGAFDDVGWTMTQEERTGLEDAGVRVLTSLHSLGDDVSEAFGGDAPNMIVRKTLYTFGQGMKVAVECALMAADAGLIDMASDLISVAGTGDGADTVIVAKPAYAKNFTDFRVREILAKPR
jgi:uncharacterized protein